MESGTHDVVTMACKDGDDVPVLPIPESYCLVITTGNDPRQLFVEFDGPDIVQVTSECEEALLGLVVPNLDSVVITSTDEHWLGFVEINSSYRTY
jgi:hypothetical protein